MMGRSLGFLKPNLAHVLTSTRMKFLLTSVDERDDGVCFFTGHVFEEYKLAWTVIRATFP